MGLIGIERDPVVGFEEGDQMDGGLFQAEADAGLGMLLAQFQQPFPERLGGGVNGLGAALAGAGVDEVQVGLFVGAIQADDQVIGMRGVHGVGLVVVVWSPAGLTRRRQYRRVVIAIQQTPSGVVVRGPSPARRAGP